MSKKDFDFDAYAGKNAPVRRPDALAPSEHAIVKEIMVEIGLGFEPDWYDGPSCHLCRRQALARLISSIKRRHEEGARIAPPIKQLFEKLVVAIRFEEQNTPHRLHRTWQVARQVIRKHVLLHGTLRNTDRAVAAGNMRRVTERIIAQPQTEEEACATRAQDVRGQGRGLYRKVRK